MVTQNNQKFEMETEKKNPSLEKRNATFVVVVGNRGAARF